MALFDVPDKVTHATVALGVALVVTAAMQPTQRYEQWEDAAAERDKQIAILDIERDYLEQSTELSPEELRLKQKDLAIQAAELERLKRHADDLRGRWEKTSKGAYVGGIGGLLTVVGGLVLWWRRDSKASAGGGSKPGA